MINGHGDDIHNHRDIRINFSSNVYSSFDHEGLFAHLSREMACVVSYPEPSPVSLETKLAELHGILPEEVMVTNGATEAIYLIAQAFNDYSHVVPAPTFSEYADAVRAAGGCLMDDALNVKQICEGITPHIAKERRHDDASKPIALWLCNPNNPTGTVLSKEKIVCRSFGIPSSLLVLDASYAAYTRADVPTAQEMVKIKECLMLHSMTKDYAIPGLRLGYVTGNSELLAKVRAKRMPWSVNALAIKAGLYLLEHQHDYVIPLDMLLCEAQRVSEAFRSIGLEVCPTDSHILLCRIPWTTSAELKEYLLEHNGIFIRDASNFNGAGMAFGNESAERCFRISVRTPEDNDELIKAISEFRSERLTVMP